MDSNLATFVWGPIAVGIWRGPVDAASVKRLELAGMTALQSSPGAGGLIGIVESTAPPPCAAMRVESAASNDRMAAHGLLGIGAVFTRSGFSGSIARGVITGLSLLSRLRYPYKVFENHVDALLWLGEVLARNGKHFDVAECARAVSQFCREYEAHWSANHGPSTSRPSDG